MAKQLLKRKKANRLWEKQNTYSLRKCKVGVASVLIGIGGLFGTTNASTDAVSAETQPSTEKVAVTVDKRNENGNKNENKEKPISTATETNRNPQPSTNPAYPEPIGIDVSTVGTAGKPQVGKPGFAPGHPTVPIADGKGLTVFADGSKKKHVQDMGTFTIQEDGTVTFDADKGSDFTAIPDQTIQVSGGTLIVKNGTITYQLEHKTIKNVQPKLINLKTNQTETSNTVTIAGEGTYTLDPSTGQVTFNPEANFRGEGTGVLVEREDIQGRKVTAKYTPHVVPNYVFYTLSNPPQKMMKGEEELQPVPYVDVDHEWQDAVIPYVPGTLAMVPVAQNGGLVPLYLVDPAHPEKGYRP